MSEPTARRHAPVRGRPLSDVFADISRDEVAARFWAKISKDGPVPEHCPELGPCWVWTGDHTSTGYGLLRRVGAHRVAMWLATAEEADGRHVLHRCDNPPCVRRSHLRYGTHKQNMEEMAERGRAAKPGLKLTDEQAEELRQRYAAGERIADLMVAYGVSQQQASRIVSGRTRKLAPVETEWRTRGLTTQRSKLTAEQRADVRRRRLAGESPTALAREFEISQPYVNEITYGRERRPRGHEPSRAPRPPLPVEVVRDIRAAHALGTVSQAQLAQKFGVPATSISRIVNGLTYRDVI